MNFKKAIYLGVDPVVAIVEGMDGVDLDEIGEWTQVENHLELKLDAEKRGAMLTAKDKAELLDRFGEPPTDATIFKLMPQQGLGFNGEGRTAIVCLREYPAGGAVVMENTGRIWSKEGRLIMTNTNEQISLEGAISESFYLIIKFQ
jgi:hypothetical protein